MKLYRYPNALMVKRKNKRTIVRRASDRPDTIIVQMSILEKEEGHFAATISTRGIKTLVMRLTGETAEVLHFLIGEYLTTIKDSDSSKTTKP